jgi:hypothetical protein
MVWVEVLRDIVFVEVVPVISATAALHLVVNAVLAGVDVEVCVLDDV